MVTDRRTAEIDRDALRLIFERLHDKVNKRTEEEKHAADRHERRAIDALRSRIKHLEPPVRSSDTWEQVRGRVEKTEEFRALDSEEARKTAFEKVIKRLKEKDEDAERERDHRKRDHNSRREDDRDYRNGSYRDRRGRASKTPEVDAYEAERRKAMADREKSYRKSSGITGLSPPRDRDRDRDSRRDRDDKYGRLERSPPPRRSHYDRERRDREDEREKLYRKRGDPHGTRDELDYGAESRSVTGSIDRRRRRGDSADSIDSSRHSKRYRRDREGSPKKSKTPPPKAEPQNVHSGSEEGEIEED